MSKNQQYIIAGLVLLLIISKGKGAGCGCGGADGKAQTPDKPAEWWSYAGQWSA